ncbi:YlzJ-like family protein [Paenibacillus turpanensis]|uniref:YlzJ-like family protein n=1 Tax=Paenibacillus turpanensis TaxID=2689078 RepID=UPI00140C1181|nr:YlzJ-like family protein [Paenibacillus turpanensis]
MIHSIVPLEMIMEGSEDIEAPEEIEYGGLLMQVRYISANQAQIVRLISADPAPYLNPAYAPGTTIQLQPKLGV